MRTKYALAATLCHVRSIVRIRTVQAKWTNLDARDPSAPLCYVVRTLPILFVCTTTMGSIQRVLTGCTRFTRALDTRTHTRRLSNASSFIELATQPIWITGMCVSILRCNRQRGNDVMWVGTIIATRGWRLLLPARMWVCIGACSATVSQVMTSH